MLRTPAPSRSRTGPASLLAAGLVLVGCAPTGPRFQAEGSRVKFRRHCEFHRDHGLPGRCLDSFYLDPLPVRQANFERLETRSPSLHSGCDSCPVERVTWDEAQSYCRKLGKRLPTFGEWMYGLWAGDPGIFDKRNPELSHFLEKSAWTAANSGAQTHPVGSLAPSSSGLYDMIGNVGEFVDESRNPEDLPAEFSGKPYFQGAKRFHGVAGAGWDRFPRTIDPTMFRFVPDNMPESWTGFRCLEPATGDRR